MKVKQLIKWIKDNNVDESIDTIVKKNPQTRKTISMVENYIDHQFDVLYEKQNIIEERMRICKKTVTQENEERLVEDRKLIMGIGNNMTDLNMIATYIEKHT